jgi:hypothetical protein
MSLFATLIRRPCLLPNVIVKLENGLATTKSFAHLFCADQEPSACRNDITRLNFNT